MKKIFMLGVLAFGLSAGLNSQAQVRINVQIGAPVMQQSWYGVDDDYYFMPDQGVYYNVRRGMYVYPYGGNWVYAPQLPPSYGGCSYNSVRYYRIRGRAPFQRHSYYAGQYPAGGYRGGYSGGYYRGDNGRHNGWYKNGRGGRGYDRDRDYRDEREYREYRSDRRGYENNGYNGGSYGEYPRDRR